MNVKKREKIKDVKITRLNTFYVAASFLLTILFIVTGSYVKGRERVTVNSISPARYTASRDIVDERATEALRQKARESVGILYAHDPGVQTAALEDVDAFFANLDEIYDSFGNEAEAAEYAQKSVLNIPVALTVTQYVNYFQLSSMGRENFKAAVKEVAGGVFDQGITADTVDNAYSLVKEKTDQTQWNVNMKNMAYLIVTGVLAPNLVPDQEAIEAARERRAAEVDEVIIRKDQKIVDEGEVITQDIYDILLSLNLVNQNPVGNIIPIVGSAVTIAILFASGYFYFATQQKKFVKRSSETTIFFILYSAAVALTRIMAGTSSHGLIPLGLFSMLAAILLNPSAALAMSVFIGVAGSFIYDGNMEFLLYFIVTGTFSALLMQYTQKRNYIVMVAAVIGLINIAAFSAIGAFFENGFSMGLVNASLIAGLMGTLSVILAVGSLPLWEAVFEVNTPLRLLELVNPNNELLRRLMIEAPGTYQHSLMVANLAENAALSTEANASLARAAAYYHDIGKLKFPLCFIENQAGDNPHDYLEPKNSAKIIKEHVRYGKELAVSAKLPRAIRDIIGQHHGTTLTSYFYVQAVKDSGIENVSEEDYRYPGPIPQSKEAAIVMLADTVEAAVRSNISTGKGMEEVEALISSLFKQKLDSGQLNDCMLTLKDIENVKDAFLNVFRGMYHQRVQYPTLEDIKPGTEDAKNDADN